MCADLWSKMPADKESPGDEDTTWGCERGPWGEQFPNLYTLVAQYQTTQGRRKGSRISFYCKDGTVVLVVTEPARGLVAFFEGKDVFGVMESAEAALEDGTAQWKPDKFKSPPAGKLPY
jgi:hypothetical protein